jgi:two-component system OmpR family sensor kinase
MFSTLRSRLIASYVLVIVICLSVTGIVVGLLVVPQAARLSYLRLAESALPVALRVLSLRNQGLSAQEIVNDLDQRSAAGSPRILLATADGEVLADSEGAWVGRQVDIPAGQEATPASRVYTQGRLMTRDGLFYYVAVSTTLRGRGGSGLNADAWYVVLLSRPRQAIAEVVTSMSVGFLLTGVAALLVSVGVAFLIARSIAKPLQRVTAATEEIARGNYEEKLDITSPEEMHRLATSFNAMAGEVKASRQAQRDFVANVSHDLKTPLTSIQGFSQAILDGTAGDEDSRQRAAQVIYEETDRMTNLVDSLLDLARIESGQVVMAREPVPLAPLLEECAEKMAPRTRQAGVQLEVAAEGDLVVSGDRDRLAQVISNLLDNALKHTPSGGRINLAASLVTQPQSKRGAHQDAHVEITVSDTGEGIPPEDLSRIFERFYRGDKSRGKGSKGAGLGLAIAREIVRAHGGEIRAESLVGLGTRFTVTLPPSTPPNP